MLAALVLGTLLVAYNTLLAALPAQTQGRVYVPLNLLLTALLLLWALTGAGLTLDQAGLLGAGWGRAALAGGLTGLLLSLPLWLMALLRLAPRGGLARLRPPASSASQERLLYHVFVRIPLGTALWEEVAFRGVLYPLLAAATTLWWGALLSSAFFVLWHIGPSLRTFVAAGVPRAGRLARLAWPTMAVGTLAGGLLFIGLREVTGHLVAPIVAHALVNASARTAFYLRYR